LVTSATLDRLPVSARRP